MKVAISFICGIVVCGLVIFGVKPVLPAQADETNNVAASEVATSENSGNILTDLLPDIDKIYRDALTSPFISAESKIQDKDIADYYSKLMDKTGLTDPNSN